jgi:hypothetical protein
MLASVLTSLCRLHSSLENTEGLALLGAVAQGDAPNTAEALAQG